MNISNALAHVTQLTKLNSLNVSRAKHACGDSRYASNLI